MKRSWRLNVVASLGLVSVFGAFTPVACGGSSFTGVAPDDTGSGGSAGAATSGTGGALEGFGEACSSDKQCKEFDLLCDDVLGCVECLADGDCTGDLTCVQGRCGSVETCDNSLDCSGSLVCDTDAQKCVECVDAGDCDEGKACVSSACVEATTCTTSGECDGQVCDPDKAVCVECVTTEDCSGGEACTDNVCDPIVSTCDKPRVILLMQRSGAMFENDWWGALTQALTGSESLITKYQGKLDLGVSLYHRETGSDDSTCPLFSEEAPPAAISNVKVLMDNAAQANDTTLAKIDAPVPEAIAAAESELSGSGTPPFIVLVTTSMPDTCNMADTPCSVDPVIASVQSAYAAGVGTYVLGLADAQFPLQPYMLQAIANAGTGQAVETLPVEVGEGSCGASQGSYAELGGNATAYIAETHDDVAAGLDSILGLIAGACE
jgi:hypothetical protein